MIFLAPMLMVIQNWTAAIVCTVIGLIAVIGLYFIWLRHVDEPDKISAMIENEQS